MSSEVLLNSVDREKIVLSRRGRLHLLKRILLSPSKLSLNLEAVDSDLREPRPSPSERRSHGGATGPRQANPRLGPIWVPFWTFKGVSPPPDRGVCVLGARDLKRQMKSNCGFKRLAGRRKRLKNRKRQEDGNRKSFIPVWIIKTSLQPVSQIAHLTGEMPTLIGTWDEHPGSRC